MADVLAVDALPDLPMAWLHRLSTTLTAESAARLRSTCKLLQQVVDATWEPEEAVPHRRSVPLTFEQIQAQLPPPEPRPDPWDDEDVSWERIDRPKQDGHNPYWQEVFGPALTRLTANQALNLLKGKTVLGFLRCDQIKVNKYSSVSDKMQLGVNSELVLGDSCGVTWPPPNPVVFSAASWNRGRGEYGWDIQPGTNYGQIVFSVKSNTPAAVVEKWGHQPQESVVWVTTEYSRLLVTTDSSCREAAQQEVQQFVASNSPDDGDKYDLYLNSFLFPDANGYDNAPMGDCAMEIYVFLGPVEPRFTGRLKVDAKQAADH